MPFCSALCLSAVAAGFGIAPQAPGGGPAALPSPVASRPLLQEARERWLHGNYEEALALYQQLAGDAGQKMAVIHWANAKEQAQLVRNTPVQCASKWKKRK